MDADVQRMVDRFEVAAAFAKEFIAELGQDRAMEMIARAFEKLQVKAGKELAETLGDNSVAALGEKCRKQAADNPNYEVLEVTDRHVALKITRCRSWEALKHLGAPEVCRAYCDSDHTFIEAFNPKMKMIRTKTLAGGDGCCNHIWALQD